MEINEIRPFKDDNNNIINFNGVSRPNIKVIFIGKNNTLNIDRNTKIKGVTFRFDCDNGICNIGDNYFTGMVRIGQDCHVTIGNGVSCTGGVYISTAEGVSVVIGDDCMIATGVEIRADDAHPFFDVISGKRINESKNISIGNHVWIGAKATILSGGNIENGSILGYGSILKDNIPNNCVAVGVPAKIIKKNIAWERPHLNLHKPYYKMDSSCVEKSIYWNKTIDNDVDIVVKKINFFERIKNLLHL